MTNHQMKSAPGCLYFYLTRLPGPGYRRMYYNRWMIFLLLVSPFISWSQKIKIVSGGLERSFILHLPKSFKQDQPIACPILICLHGKGSNGREMKMYTGLNATSDKAGMITVYPTAEEGVWPYEDTGKIRMEITYLNNVIDHIVSRYHGDPDRIYMAGMSSGGIFTFTFALQFPAVLRGIAVVSGNISFEASKELQKNLPLLPPLLFIHGTSDFLYPGRPEQLLTAEESFAVYTSWCTDTLPGVEWLPDSQRKDKCRVERLTYCCPKKMVYYRIHHGGHHWPGAEFNAALFTSLKLGNFCRDFTANEAILDFITFINTGDGY